jgi:hypothetical protein
MSEHIGCVSRCGGWDEYSTILTGLCVIEKDVLQQFLQLRACLPWFAALNDPQINWILASFLLRVLDDGLSPVLPVRGCCGVNAMSQTTPFRGGRHNPSAWSRRLPVILFSLLGYLIATYLAFYQAGLISSVWEPFFGNGSRMILKESAIARYSPIPDALLGAYLYLLDVFLNCLGGEDRWRTAPWTVLAVGLVSSTLALGGVLLALSQPLVFHHYCTFCLAATTCSLLAAAFAAEEVRTALHHVRSKHPHQA